MTGMDIYTAMCMAIDGTMAAGFTAFLVFLYGRENSFIHKMGVWNTWTVKIVLGMCAAWSLVGVMTAEGRRPQEAALHASVAALFVWAAVFHYNRFVKVQSKAAARRRRSAAGRGGTGGALQPLDK